MAHLFLYWCLRCSLVSYIDFNLCFQSSSSNSSLLLLRPLLCVSSVGGFKAQGQDAKYCSFILQTRRVTIRHLGATPSWVKDNIGHCCITPLNENRLWALALWAWEWPVSCTHSVLESQCVWREGVLMVEARGNKAGLTRPHVHHVGAMPCHAEHVHTKLSTNQL